MAETTTTQPQRFIYTATVKPTRTGFQVECHVNGRKQAIAGYGDIPRRGLAHRLARAIRNGAVYRALGVQTSRSGNPYMAWERVGTVTNRTMSDDLGALGY